MAVRIRIGESWKHNPAYRRALVALAEGRSRGFSPREIVDVLGIEVDGVDLARGAAEAPLLDAMAALVRAARSLAAAEGSACVVLPRAPVELRLARSGDDVRLSLALVSDGTLLVRDVAVEPSGLWSAACRAALGFVGDLGDIHPALSSLRVVQDLAREADRVPSPVPLPTQPAPPAPDDPDDPVPPVALAPGPVRRAAAVRAPDLPRSGLRRLMLRPAWRAEGPGRRVRLERCGGAILATGEARTQLRTPDGTLVWEAPVGDARVVRGGTGDFVAGRGARGALVVLEAAAGTCVQRSAAALGGRLREAFELEAGGFAACDGTRLVAVASGRRRWTFDPGTGRSLHVRGYRLGFVTATDSGELRALAPDGRPCWHCDTELDPLEHLVVAEADGIVLAVGVDGRGRGTVVARELNDGQPVWRHGLGGLRPGLPAWTRRRLLVGYESVVGPALACVETGHGRALWNCVVPGGGDVVAVPDERRILVARAGGGLLALRQGGGELWRQGPLDPDPSLSPARPRPPVVGAGIAVVGAALVHVCDAATGRPLACVEPEELAPEALLLLDGPVVVAAGQGGRVLEAWSAAGHLRVV